MTLNLSYPRVMGILNITPDSFSDDGCYKNLNQALTQANALISAGAIAIDVGGESTRPGALEISEEEEIARVIPVIEALASRFEVCISVDTSKAGVIREAAQVGAHIINDVRALQEPGALDAAVKSGLPVCLMHMRGQPSTMQEAPYYDDLIADVKVFFKNHIKRCNDAGIIKQKLLLDPGFGFGKNITHNYQLLSRLSEFHKFGLPLLVGMSRKSMIKQLLNAPAKQCVIGSVACAVIAAIQGVQILRVHDVKETVEAMRIVGAILSVKGY